MLLLLLLLLLTIRSPPSSSARHSHHPRHTHHLRHHPRLLQCHHLLHHGQLLGIYAAQPHQRRRLLLLLLLQLILRRLGVGRGARSHDGVRDRIICGLFVRGGRACGCASLLRPPRLRRRGASLGRGAGAAAGHQRLNVHLFVAIFSKGPK
ncbi:hypothetical protein ACHAWF_017549 [Thalassiosira exigua]